MCRGCVLVTTACGLWPFALCHLPVSSDFPSAPLIRFSIISPRPDTYLLSNHWLHHERRCPHTCLCTTRVTGRYYKMPHVSLFVSAAADILTDSWSSHTCILVLHDAYHSCAYSILQKHSTNLCGHTRLILQTDAGYESQPSCIP